MGLFGGGQKREKNGRFAKGAGSQKGKKPLRVVAHPKGGVAGSRYQGAYDNAREKGIQDANVAWDAYQKMLPEDERWKPNSA